ncbi:hypothetical protein LZ198_15605 [Myxococcus sp. K15C18031901]|uniref:hypothetical protein n=1 Tax=Myxococcus dinghuensis TaxID=2906761 RepID=UPI0020A6FA30|nr:hypothetical protein [Myxococcus dinghuensis]MCP3100296.1 hypothetical protein [Myxococcus dinghuensis]
MLRYVIALAGALSLCACSDDAPKVAPQDAGTPTSLERPGALERPPRTGGLPADLKPPGR